MPLLRKADAKFEPQKLSVLVIDDNTYIRNIVSEVLRNIGVYQIFLARSGAEGLSEIAQWQPRVVITDWDMTAMNGIEFTRTVRRDMAWPERALPIILMTTNNTRAHVEEARMAGVDEFILKPITAAAVVSRLQEVTLRPREFIQSPKYVGPCRRRRPLSPDYQGPKRRLADPIAGMAEDPENDHELQRKLVVEGMERIAKIAAGFRTGDRLQLRAIYSGACEVYHVARELEDPLLERATRSLVRYIEGVGATEAMEADVVCTHTDAIVQILRMPFFVSEERESVAVGLERVVDKKLAATV